MSLPNTAFVIAADVDMVRHAVSEQFSGASKKHVDDYLDKLIQFPVAVPRLGLQEVQAFLIMLMLSRSPDASEENCETARKYLLDKIQKSWSDNSGISASEVVKIVSAGDDLKSQIDTALRIAPILAHSKAVMGNPRIIKRMMNIVKMRYNLAKRRGMELDEAVITKISLFERCTNEAAFGDLLKVINTSQNGKSKHLSGNSLAKVADDADGYPESWQEHRDFISEWGQLTPDLSKIDLRPAVYLARETLPLQIKSVSLSTSSIQAISALLKVATRTSKAAETAVAQIPSDERTQVMTELVSALRQSGDWTRKRTDVNGPIILALKYPETKDELLRFLADLPKPAPWLRSLIESLEREGK